MSLAFKSPRHDGKTTNAGPELDRPEEGPKSVMAGPETPDKTARRTALR
jgi:hypothetical protein